METFEQIKDEVDNNGGIITIEAWRLRDAAGAGRLTQRINVNISDGLRQRGLGHVPFRAEDLPTYQNGQVRVFDSTTAVGKVIQAAHETGENNDEILRESVDGGAANILEQVRVLVADD